MIAKCSQKSTDSPVLKLATLYPEISGMTIAKDLEAYTAQHSNFDKKRPYISLSHISLSDEEILNQWFNGFKDGHDVRLRCYKGYQMEKDLLERLKAVYGDRLKTGIEYTAENGLFKCHPDFELDGDPGDCKSVPLDEHLPEGRVPRKVFLQLQAQILYGRKQRGYVIYESRETGRIRDYLIRADFRTMEWIDEKVRRIKSQIPSCA